MINWTIKRRVELYGNGSANAGAARAYVGDAKAHTWVVDVTENGAPASLTGYTAVANIRRGDGTIVQTGSISGNRVTVTLPQSAYTQGGTVTAILRLVNAVAGINLVVDAVEIIVIDVGSGTIIDPGNVVPTINDLLSRIGDMATATAAALAAAAAANSYVGSVTASTVPTTGGGSVQAALNQHAATLGGHTTELGAHAATLGNHAATLGGHTTELNAHSAALSNHAAALNGQTATLGAHAATLDEHTARLDTQESWQNWQVATGNPATCYPVPGSRLYPEIDLIATQSGSGDPSPENIRPIVPAVATGGKVRVRQTGKNMLYIPNGTATAGGITVTVQDGEITINGTVTSGYPWFKLSFGLEGVAYTPTPQNRPDWYAERLVVTPSRYTLSKSRMSGTSSSTTEPRVMVKDANNETVASLTVSATSSTDYGSGRPVCIMIYCGGAGTAITNIKFRLQLELGTQVTSNEPAVPFNDIEIANNTGADWYGLPGLGDELFVQKIGNEWHWLCKKKTGLRIITGTEAWSLYAGSGGRPAYVASPSLITNRDVGAGATALLSNCFRPNTSGDGGTIRGAPTGQTIAIVPLASQSIDTVEKFKTWTKSLHDAGNPICIVYVLATPIVHDLGPVNGLQGLLQTTRYAPRANVATAEVGSDSAPVQALRVGYAKSPIQEAAEIRAAITSLGGAFNV